MPKKEGQPEFSDAQIKARIVHDQEQNPVRWRSIVSESQSAQVSGGILPLQKIEEQIQDLDTLYDNFMELSKEVHPDATQQESLLFTLGLMRVLGIITDKEPSEDQ